MPKQIQDTPADAQKMRRKSGIDKRVSEVDTRTNGRIGGVESKIDNLRYTDLSGGIPTRAYEPESMPGGTLVNLNAGRLVGTLRTELFGGLSVPNSALSSVNGGKITGVDVMPGAVVQVGSMHGNRVADGTLGGVKLAPNTVGGRELDPILYGGPQNANRMRQIDPALWGGNSGKAAAANHGHSISFKELPLWAREKITAGRTSLHENMTPVTQMTPEDLSRRVWLLERLLAAVLHMGLDDPYQATSIREGRIASGEKQDISLLRYPGGEQEYRSYHPEASALFDSFDVSEIAV